MSFLFSSESVTEGHPDKIADQISDAILDDILRQDPEGRVACETFVTTGLVLVGGEITTSAYVDIPRIARGVIKRIGYTDASMGFDYQTCSVLTSIDKQSGDIAMGVDEHSDHAQGAGDQGMMFGYACDDTSELMPLPIHLAHALTRRMAEVRKDGILPYLRPDGKSQVTVEYDTQSRTPQRVTSIVLSNQHEDSVDVLEEMRRDLVEHVIRSVIPENLLDLQQVQLLVNPTGRFVVGGPQGDAGLTGRKIIVDTYGGTAPHGGGAFSGKDPSKVDRSATYMARYIAKNLVAAKVARRCTVQLAYAIGVADPVSVMIDTEGTGTHDNTTLEKIVRDVFPLRPAQIIEALQLKRPQYFATAAYGHFGREGFSWEATDRVADIETALKTA